VKRTWEKTYGKEMGSNVWNIDLEDKYTIILEYGNEDISITYKSCTLKLPHH
jgi:hypothetical protein